MAEFRRKSETELALMGDEELVAYIVAAREANDLGAARVAMGILGFGYADMIELRVRRKVPPSDVDDVVMNVYRSLARSAFDGHVLGEFVSFLLVVTARRIADYHRSHENDPDQLQLESEWGGAEGIRTADPGEEGPEGMITLQDAIERVLASRNDMHRRIIDLYGQGIGAGYSAAGTVEILAREGLETSEANVQQVWHRFKKDLRDELDKGQDGGTSDG